MEETSNGSTEVVKTHIQVAVEDYLKVMNLQLQAKNIQLELQLLQTEVNKKVMERGTIASDMETIRTIILKKYGVDLATCIIHPDGTVTDQRGNRL